MSYLDPSEPWPNHSRPEARAALKEAAKAGWHFRPSSGHIFGTIKCSAIGQPGACTMPVYSTSGPADGSVTAKKIRSMLRKCPHQPVPDGEAAEATSPRSDAELENSVALLMDAVGGLDERERADRAIDVAIAEDDVTEFEEQAEHRDRGDNAAQMAFDLLGRPLVPWPPAIAREELLAEAENLASSMVDREAAERALELVRLRRG